MPIRDILLLPHFWIITTSMIFSSIAIVIVILVKNNRNSYLIHVVLMSLGILLNVIGIILLTILRLNALHGILGMNAANLFVTAAIGGILAKSKIKRKDQLKKIHIWWGAIVFIYTIAVAIIGIISV